MATAVLVFLWFGITAYAVLAGADFGAGVWDLLGSGAARGPAMRRRLAASIGPVWEANHVWLIFAMVVLWTAFPPVFAAIMSSLFIPLSLVAFGIIVRGSSFALRQASPELMLKRAFTPGFGLASLVTPFFLGTVAGAIASGRVPAGIARGDILRSWVAPTPLLAGALAVSACAFLAAAYLMVDAHNNREADLAEAFRHRSLVAGTVCGGLSVAATQLLRLDAPTLYAGLSGVGLPLVLASVILGASSLIAIWARRFRLVRVTSAGAVITILWAWAAAQYPQLLVGSITVRQAAAPGPTLTALLIALSVGAVLVLPSMALLFHLARLPRVSHDET